LGVCRVGSGGRWWLQAFPKTFGRWGSFGMAFFIPGVREFSLMVGACDASKETLAGRIEDGESIHLIPGGIKEMMLTDESATDTKLVLKNRSGFVRLAWEHGLDVVPVFCFGEKWTSKRVLLPAFIRRIMARFRMAGTMLTGRWGTLLPLIYHKERGELTIGWVFGEPIPVKRQQLKEISSEEEGDIRRIFDSVDTKRDESIDVEELREAVQEGKVRTMLPLKRLLREMSREAETMMDFEQFKRWCRGELAIMQIHARYISEMRRIFETYKKNFGYGLKETLTVVDALATNESKKKA